MLIFSLRQNLYAYIHYFSLFPCYFLLLIIINAWTSPLLNCAGRCPLMQLYPFVSTEPRDLGMIKYSQYKAKLLISICLLSPNRPCENLKKNLWLMTNLMSFQISFYLNPFDEKNTTSWFCVGIIRANCYCTNVVCPRKLQMHWWLCISFEAVSYTHLTLPTICSV